MMQAYLNNTGAKHMYARGINYNNIPSRMESGHEPCTSELSDTLTGRALIDHCSDEVHEMSFGERVEVIDLTNSIDDILAVMSPAAVAEFKTAVTQQLVINLFKSEIADRPSDERAEFMCNAGVSA